jgi:hypothetical protein
MAWLAPDRACDEIHGLVVLSGVEGENSEEVKRVGVLAVVCKRSPATKLGIVMAASTEVVESGSVKFGG